MNLINRINALVRLGDHLRQKDEYLEAIMARSQYHNQWFTLEDQQKAIDAIAKQFLARPKLESWLQAYDVPETNESKTVGLVLAGNIPLVGFHDILSVFVAGHRAQIKLSEKDPYLLPYLIKLLGEIDPATQSYFEIVPNLKDFTAVVATGSNNSARYFEAYFGKYPHIIRKNRNAIAVLSGQETPEELLALGNDIFQYFGLGCRNVSKIYVPVGYDFDPLLEATHHFRKIILHNKYKNNFDYNYALYILNKTPFLGNGCIILTENPSLQSRIANVHYSYYDSMEGIETALEERKAEIQCIVAREGILEQKTFPFGTAQEPELWEYADGVDTMAFLLGL